MSLQLTLHGDYFFRKPIIRRFVGNNEARETLADMRRRGVRVFVLMVKPGGYELQLEEIHGEKTKAMGGGTAGKAVDGIGGILQEMR